MVDSPLRHTTLETVNFIGILWDRISPLPPPPFNGASRIQANSIRTFERLQIFRNS